MTSDNDDVEQETQENEEEEQEEVGDETTQSTPSKNKRFNKPKIIVYDPSTDQTVLAILKFFEQDPLPTITRSVKLEWDDKSVSVGQMMYTLRNKAQDPHDEQTPLVQQRLAYLAKNESWNEFMKQKRAPRGTSQEDGKSRKRKIVADETSLSTPKTKKQYLLERVLQLQFEIAAKKFNCAKIELLFYRFFNQFDLTEEKVRLESVH